MASLQIDSPAAPAAPVPAPDVAPVDASRPPVASPAATHIVTSNAVGDWQRGDRLSADDHPLKQQGIDRLVALKAIRPLSADELASNPAAPAVVTPARGK